MGGRRAFGYGKVDDGAHLLRRRPQAWFVVAGMELGDRPHLVQRETRKKGQEDSRPTEQGMAVANRETKGKTTVSVSAFVRSSKLGRASCRSLRKRNESSAPLHKCRVLYS